MAVGSNIGADIASYVKQIEQQADVVARDNTIMAALVRGFSDQSGTAIRARSEYGTATITQIADTDDLSSQTFVPSVANQLTPYEFGGQFFITDTRLRNDPFNYAVEAANELGMAMAQKVEKDLLALFASLTGGTINMGAGNMTWGALLAAQSILRTQNPGGQFAAVLHPYQFHSLGTAVTPAAQISQANAPDLQNALLQNFWMGRAYGIDIYTTSNLTSGTAVRGGLFVREALALDVRVAPSIEPERDSSRRGYELNLTSTYAAGAWRPAFGVQIISQGTAPTA